MPFVRSESLFDSKRQLETLASNIGLKNRGNQARAPVGPMRTEKQTFTRAPRTFRAAVPCL